MSLPVLAVLVVLGIAGIVLGIHATGGTVNARFADASAALARFAEDFPEETVGGVILTAHGSAAFVALAGGRTGIVQAIGDRFLTRIHTPGEDFVTPLGPTGLAIRTGDFTWRGARHAFASAAARDRVAGRLTGRDLSPWTA